MATEALPTPPTVKIDLDANYDHAAKTGLSVSLTRGLNLYYLFLDTFHAQHNDILIKQGTIMSYSFCYSTEAPLDDDLAEHIAHLANLVPEAKVSVRIKNVHATKTMPFYRDQMTDGIPAMVNLMKVHSAAEIVIEPEHLPAPKHQTGVTINYKVATPEDIKLLETSLEDLFSQYDKDVVHNLLGLKIPTLGQLIAHTAEHLMTLKWHDYEADNRKDHWAGKLKPAYLDIIRKMLRKNNFPPLGTVIDNWRPEEKPSEGKLAYNVYTKVNGKTATELQYHGAVHCFEHGKAEEYGDEMVNVKEGKVSPEKFRWIKASLLRYRLLPGDKIENLPINVVIHRRRRY